MVIAIILSAGKSSRFIAPIPKQLYPVKGKPLFLYALQAFYSLNKKIDKYVLVVDETNKKQYWDILKDKYSNLFLVEGGNSRHESLKLGIDFCEKLFKINNGDFIITHDVARPLVSPSIINSHLNLMAPNIAISTILENCDSLCKIENHYKNVDRDNIYFVQTPQSFDYSLWKNVKDSPKITDFFAALNIKKDNLKTITGSVFNFKITTKEDFELLEKILTN